MNATKLSAIQESLKTLGFTLENEQPHIAGERFLMAKEKLVLVGKRDSDGKRVAIKASITEAGRRDITNEKNARDLLQSVAFTNQAIHFPEELLWTEKDGTLFWAIEFIEQEKVFVAHTLEEQFFLALNAFEAQESFHATTYEHLEKVKKVFPIFYAQEYFKEFSESKRIIMEKYPNTELEQTLDRTEEFLRSHKSTIDTYANYLTHTDFVPHNFRIRGRTIYMLDCAPEARTVHFGNKYEGWARFLNYMVIHNPELDRLLSEYLRKKRGENEYLSLRLMRAYKIVFLLRFYAESLEATEGDLRELTLKRLAFWHQILKYVLDDMPIPKELIEDYKGTRDTLRSDEEKKRQMEFAVA
ncbi:MAG: hypothetical protein JWN50_438 [Parcubacteria group bacterium]|nr:hypothetical protein [Parcubacteria group bacterium]